MQVAEIVESKVQELNSHPPGMNCKGFLIEQVCGISF